MPLELSQVGPTTNASIRCTCTYKYYKTKIQNYHILGTRWLAQCYKREAPNPKFGKLLPAKTTFDPTQRQNMTTSQLHFSQ